MRDDSSPIVLSECYELVRGEDLKQGDIFEDCLVLQPPPNLSWPVTEACEEISVDVVKQDVVVMSQSCDLELEQKSDMWLVILCPIWNLSEAARVNPFLGSDFGKEECRRGHMPGYHMIRGCEHEKWNRAVSIVSFREVWSLPLKFVRDMARARNLRPRIRPPYREHLAQSFARYFMRVGLPVDIAPFKSPKAECEVMKKLGQMDNQARERVFASFGR
jgi:hypothetical protein